MFQWKSTTKQTQSLPSELIINTPTTPLWAWIRFRVSSTSDWKPIKTLAKYIWHYFSSIEQQKRQDLKSNFNQPFCFLCFYSRCQECCVPRWMLGYIQSISNRKSLGKLSEYSRLNQTEALKGAHFALKMKNFNKLSYPQECFTFCYVDVSSFGIFLSFSRMSYMTYYICRAYHYACFTCLKYFSTKES